MTKTKWKELNFEKEVHLKVSLRKVKRVMMTKIVWTMVL